jgi:hypothetical protein
MSKEEVRDVLILLKAIMPKLTDIWRLLQDREINGEAEIVPLVCDSCEEGNDGR